MEFLKRAHAAELVSLDRRLARHVPDFGAGAGRSHHKPAALYAFQPGVHERAGAAIAALLARPQDAALLSLCPGRRRDGAQLRHPDLQRHCIFRVQRRCARRPGSAATGRRFFSRVSTGTARKPPGSHPRERKKKKKPAKRVRARGKSKTAPTPHPRRRQFVHPFLFRHLFRSIGNRQVSPRHGGKRLNAIDRLTDCGGTSS